MPSDDRIGLNHLKGRSPRTPNLGKPGPKGPIQRRQAGSLGAPVQDEQLVPQGQVFQEHAPPRFQRRGGEVEDQNQPNDHALQRPAHALKTGAFSGRMRLLPTTAPFELVDHAVGLVSQPVEGGGSA